MEGGRRGRERVERLQGIVLRLAKDLVIAIDTYIQLRSCQISKRPGESGGSGLPGTYMGSTAGKRVCTSTSKFVLRPQASDSSAPAVRFALSKGGATTA